MSGTCCLTLINLEFKAEKDGNLNERLMKTQVVEGGMKDFV